MSVSRKAHHATYKLCKYVVIQDGGSHTTYQSICFRMNIGQYSMFSLRPRSPGIDQYIGSDFDANINKIYLE